MPRRLDASSPDFAAQFADFLTAKRDTEATADQAARDIVTAVRAEGDAALFTLYPALRPLSHWARHDTYQARGNGRCLCRHNAASARGLGTRCSPHPRFSRTAAPGGPRLYRCRRCRPRPALDTTRQRRCICAGRDSCLSILRADERHPSQSGWRCTHRYGRANPRITS